MTTGGGGWATSRGLIGRLAQGPVEGQRSVVTTHASTWLAFLVLKCLKLQKMGGKQMNRLCVESWDSGPGENLTE